MSVKRRKEIGQKNKRGGGCQPFPKKFYGIQRSRTSSFRFDLKRYTFDLK